MTPEILREHTREQVFSSEQDSASRPRYFVKARAVQRFKRGWREGGGGGGGGGRDPPVLKLLKLQISALAADLGKVHCSLFTTCYILFKFPLAS